MSQNTLIDKITKEAENKVAEIKSQGKLEVDNIKRELETELKKLKSQYEDSLARKKAHNELVAVSKARQAGNIAVQTVGRKQLDRIFNQAIADLVKLPSEDYVALFTNNLKSAVPVDAEVTKVLAPKDRQSETEAILANAKLSAEVESSTELQAGLVIHTKDGIYDLSLERILNERRDQLEMQVVKEIMK
jgi:vacuolar-type H+-ATPase subunit E/Vma4